MVKKRMQKKQASTRETWVYAYRWHIIALWLIVLLGCVPFLPTIVSPFKTTGFIDEHSESARTSSFLDKKLAFDKGNRFILLYSSRTLLATDARFNEKIRKSLVKLKHFPIKADIFLPEDNPQQISKDKHTAYVAVILRSTQQLNDGLLTQFKKTIKKPSEMQLLIGGEPIFVEDLSEQTKEDLYKADFIATPVALLTLLIVFGSVIAALLPIVLGGGCALIILTLLYFMGHFVTLSVFTLNIALLLGLCLCLDYSLFIISRFRDELDGNSVQHAIANSQRTAGRAIVFSGIAVFASLSALLLFPVNILFSMAVGGLTAVFVAVLTAVVILPAVLSILGVNINRFSVRRLKVQETPRKPNIWHRIAATVVQWPVCFLIIIMVVLLGLGYPLLSAKFGISDFRIFPEQSKDRKFFNTYAKKFNEEELTPISIVIQTDPHPVLAKPELNKIYDLTRELKSNPLVRDVGSIVTLNKTLTKRQYDAIYAMPKTQLDTNMRALLNTTTGKEFTVVNVISRYPVNSPKTKTLVNELRDIKAPNSLTLRFTGTPVSNMEVLKGIGDILPYAMLWIMIFTYCVLFILLRSVILPFKAILANLLSLAACYGALVLVFQEGYLHYLLNFEPQGTLDISLLVIIFCALFGFSMDYEVFLLSRIKEMYELTHENRASIIFGIEKSGRIITSAAMIVIVICGSFLVADVLMVKAFGLGIAVAIFVDAFLIRTILVPAVMTLLGKWNWYLPDWLSNRSSNQ